MAREPSLSTSAPAAGRADRLPPYSEEAEKGVLGSILLDSTNVMDLCTESGLVQESFYVPAHRLIYDVMQQMSAQGQVIDVLTLSDRLRHAGRIEDIGGAIFLERLIDFTPTAAHAEYYIDIVRQKFLLRAILQCAREAENECHASPDEATLVLSRVQQAFMDITERGGGNLPTWSASVKQTMEHIEQILTTRRGLSGVSTGFLNLDQKLQGLRSGEMIVLAARPSMGKTSLAMNIAENVSLGKMDPDRTPRSVGIFSLEMSHDVLVMRMLCSHARVSSFRLSGGYVSAADHAKLIQAASVLTKAAIFLDDTGGLDILEVRARARRMKKKYNIELIVIDYLQLLHSKEYARQGKQIETAHISGNLKAMAKELRLPVLVLSQLSRAPEQRDKLGTPKLSDLRDSGAIEQDADVVCLLRRPCRYPDDEKGADKALAVVDVAKHRNGPTGEVELNFEEDYTLFSDRAYGVDGVEAAAGEPEGEEAESQ